MYPTHSGTLCWASLASFSFHFHWSHTAQHRRARVAEYFQWNIRDRGLQFSSVWSLCDFYAALNLTHRFASRNHQKMHHLFGAESSIINHSADGSQQNEHVSRAEDTFFSLPPFFACLRKGDRSQNRVLTAPWLTAYSRTKSQWQGCVPYIPCAWERNNNTTKKKKVSYVVCLFPCFIFVLEPFSHKHTLTGQSRRHSRAAVGF